MLRVRRAQSPLKGRVRVPGDKSISHRAILFASLAEGVSEIEGFLDGADCNATCGVIRALGIEVEAPSPTRRIVHGRGLEGWRKPTQVLDCANSGTTLRLLLGPLAGRPFTAVLTGTPQLCSRPMGRVTVPLRELGAEITGAAESTRAPLTIRGGALSGLDHRSRVASAQVKSCLLLAGLFAPGGVRVTEPAASRDHTEILLASMGAPLVRAGLQVSISPPTSPLRPIQLEVPGDPSSAAFLLVAAAIVAGSHVRLERVGTNPTRSGLAAALRSMGADLVESSSLDLSGEPTADLVLRQAPLRGIRLAGAEIVRAIDELPVFAVAATQAEGETVIADAGELRVKETDRIATTISELRKLGAEIEERPDGMVIHGPTPLRGCDVESHGDHRLALALAVAGLVAEGETVIHGAEVTGDSFPGFAETLARLGGEIVEESS
ncbi:MAG: 3-phosphoshikimate 1-carboxyvinyltransferase [Planctomycetes bacterium]|nr:3-phosphoshikimate 1-carboxyvinyltransferase [Planctomycetota bacterium]